MNIINTIPEPGTKVRIKMIGAFGDIVEIDGKIAGRPFHHGYLCRESGSWALFPGGGFDIPCYKVPFLKKRKRRPWAIMLEDIKEIEVRE